MQFLAPSPLVKNFSLLPEEFAKFQTAANEVLRVLDSLTPEVEAVEADDDDKSVCEVAVEKELCREMAKKIRTMGYFPVAGNIYLFYLLCAAILKNWFVLLLTTVYLCSGLIAIKGGILNDDRNFLYAGCGCFAFAYIATSILAFRKVIFPKIPKVIWLLPGLNIFYLLLRWIMELEWSKFLLSLAGLAAFAGAVILLCLSLPGWSFASLIASWIIGIVCGSIWGKKCEE